MQTKQFVNVSDYLNTCYEDSFVGGLFDLHGQGVPLMMPLDQEAMVTAVQLDSKISQGLYTRLGEDVSVLKKHITAQVSRSIATGMTFAQTAKQLSNRTRIGYNNAIRIARTEGHRIQNQATMNVMEQAKERGADVVKQWDATLDGRTRESHAAVDGQIREVDEPFSNGLMYPGDPAGGAAEVINCRCALLQRARWALDEDELETLKERAEYFGLDKADQFDDFKKKYLKAVKAPEPVMDDRFGIKMIQGKHGMTDDLPLCNPKYSTGHLYQNNCGYCSVAYDIRRRGYDVEAMPKNGLYTYEWQALWDGFRPHGVNAKRKNTALAEMTEEIQSWGEGARGSVFVVWDGHTWGHYFSVEVINGEAVFIDPQNGKSGQAVADYFKRVKPSSIRYGRVDNLELSDKITEAVKTRGD
jgi:SPP1 gp7 family putative phage head morphogenesis protein